MQNTPSPAGGALRCPDPAGSHDNIVQLRGLCSHGADLYLVMELCPRWLPPSFP